MTDFHYDIVSIGGGTAGLVTAAGARYIGAQSAVIERAQLGGDCLWTGCVPSKALIASARLAHAMRSAEKLGLVGASPAHAFSEVMNRMRAARATVAHHDDPERFREMGVGVHFGGARFVKSGVIEVEGVGRVRSKRFVIATGATPAIPPIPGLAEAGYLTHHTAFDQTELPRRIAILGGGPIGLEFAQVYARLGATVTVVEMAPSILPREDSDVASFIQSTLEAEGIVFSLGDPASRVDVVDGEKLVHTSAGTTITADEIFVATGRRPATDGLELDRAGVETDRGAVRVDNTLRTTGKGVWAAGDVTGGLQFTHVADYMAKTVIRNALLPLSSSIDYALVPWVTYTDPEVAHIGLSEEEATARGATTYRYDLRNLDRAIVDGLTEGFVKVSASRKGKVLGATVVAHGAGEMLMPFAIAMKHGISLDGIAGTIFPYPTMAEGVLRASNEYRRTKLDGTGGRLLKKVVGWLS